VSAQGRLLATGGATQLEGAAGGGIVPWALLAGYGTADESRGTAFYTHVGVSDYSLDVVGFAWTFRNRVELSLAQQEFDLGTLGSVVLPSLLGVDASGETLRQQILGVKVRLFGDAVYTRAPQVSAGLQWKRNLDFEIPETVGATDDEGVDVYVAVTKLVLGGFAGRNLLLNGTLRATEANQMGLLGFGGDLSDSHELVAEISVGVFLNRTTAIGVEFRQKPDNLGFAKEDDWADLFFAYFPNKNFSLVAAYARLGEIATIDNQNGLFFNAQVSF